jgi:hypothetical protein
MNLRAVMALALALACAAAYAHAQTPSAQFPVRDVLQALEQRWVYRSQVAWPEVTARITANDRPAQQIVALLAEQGDVHTSFQFAGQTYSHWEAFDDTTLARLRPLLALEQAQQGQGVAKMLQSNIAYVRVPGMAPADSTDAVRMGHALLERVQALAAGRPRAWIVDLRLNGGGSVYPMLLGTAPLLGPGIAGGTVDGQGTHVQDWRLGPDGLYWSDRTGRRRFAELTLPLRTPAAAARVVVLLGPLTRSSGQALALAFRGRPGTLFLGEPTAKGYTTVTAPVPVGDAVFLNLAVGTMTDRRGAACPVQVLPDSTLFGGESFDDLEQDRAVAAARRWLLRPRR